MQMDFFSNVDHLHSLFFSASEQYVTTETYITDLPHYAVLPRVPILLPHDNKSHLIAFVSINNQKQYIPLLYKLGILSRRYVQKIAVYRLPLPNIGTVDVISLYRDEYSKSEQKPQPKIVKLQRLGQTNFSDTEKVFLDLTPVVAKAFERGYQIAFRILDDVHRYIQQAPVKHKSLLLFFDVFYLPTEPKEVKPIRETYGYYVFRNFELIYETVGNLDLIAYNDQDNIVRTISIYSEKTKDKINIEQARQYFWTRYRGLYVKWLQYVKAAQPEQFGQLDIDEYASAEDIQSTVKPVSRAVDDIFEEPKQDPALTLRLRTPETDSEEGRLLNKLYQQRQWLQRYVIPRVEKELVTDFDEAARQKLVSATTKFAQVRLSLARKLYEQYGPEGVLYAALLDRGQTDQELEILVKQLMLYKKSVSDREFKQLLKQLAQTRFEIEEYYRPELAKSYVTSFLDTLAAADFPVQDVNRRRVKEQALLPYLISIIGTIQTKNGLYQVLSVEKVVEQADASDIKYTLKAKYRIRLLTPFGYEETIEVNLPELIDDEYFIIGGHRKVLMYQIINKPIAITKRHIARITTNYQIIRVEYKPKSDRFVVYISGIKQLPPLGIIMAYGGIQYLDRLGVEYTCTEEPQHPEYPYSIQIKDGYLHLRPTIQRYAILVSTFTKDPNFTKVLAKLTCADLEQPEKIQNAILETYRFRKGKEAEEYRIALQKALDFIDPVTRLLLLQEGMVPDPAIVLAEAALKAYQATTEPEHPLSLDQARIRWSEMLVEVLFKELSRSIRLFEADVGGGKKPGQDTTIGKYFNPDTVINKLQVDTANQYKLPMLLQHAEYSSPLEELSTTFAFKPTGPDGLRKEAIQPWHRDIHDTWYGIVSAVDTPENENIGIKNHLTITGATNNVFGIYQLKQIAEDKDGANILSPIEVLIPFIETNDGNRVMLASNQMRSITPIFKNEPPVIQTGYEGILPHLLSRLFVVRAKKDGKVLEIGKGYVLVQYDDGTTEFIDVNPRILKTGKGEFGLEMRVKVKVGQTFKKGEIIAESTYLHDGVLALGANVLVAFMHLEGLTYEDGIVVSETFAKKIAVTIRNETITIPLKTTYTVTEIVRPGQEVKPGQVILAYQLPLVSDAELGSLEEQLESEGIEIESADEVSELFGFSAEVAKDSVVIRTRKGGIVESVEIYANVDLYKHRKAFEPLIPVYEQFKKEYDKYIEAYNKATETSEPQYLVRTTKDGLFTYREKPYPVIIRIRIRTYRAAKPGDKLANRHGNKGVISAILPDELMPKTEYGETVHVILDPMGVINRMNIGQEYEGALGYIAKHLYEHAEKAYRDRKEEGLRQLYLDIYSTLYSGNDRLKNEFIVRINRLSKTDLTNLWHYIQKYRHVPIIIPPFRSPSWQTKDINPNIIHDNIYALANKYNIKLEQHLFLPLYNKRTEKPVQVGYLYMQKLEHVTEEVAHARSIGLMSRITKQAIRGRKKGGGFRIGEFDTFTLIANDAPNVIKELYFVNADDPDSLMDVYASILRTGEAHLPEKLKNKPARELFDIFLLGQHVKLNR